MLKFTVIFKWRSLLWIKTGVRFIARLFFYARRLIPDQKLFNPLPSFETTKTKHTTSFRLKNIELTPPFDHQKEKHFGDFTARRLFDVREIAVRAQLSIENVDAQNSKKFSETSTWASKRWLKIRTAIYIFMGFFPPPFPLFSPWNRYICMFRPTVYPIGPLFPTEPIILPYKHMHMMCTRMYYILLWKFRNIRISQSVRRFLFGELFGSLNLVDTAWHIRSE